MKPSHSRAATSLVVVALLVVGCGAETSPGPEEPEPEEPAPPSLPTFSITSPARGSMLVAGTLDPGAISVIGRVCDPLYPITSLSIDGVAVPVTGANLCESFNVSRESRWGLTLLEGQAQNSNGDIARLAQSFLRGPSWGPPDLTGMDAGRVPHGLMAQLNQSLLDDGTRAAPVDDIATLLSLAATAVNWTTLMPNPLQVQPDANGDGLIDTRTHECPLQTRVNDATGFRVTHGTFAVSPIATGLQVVPGQGLGATMRLNNVSLPVSVFGSLDLGAVCLGNTQATVTGTLTATSITFTWLMRAIPDLGGLTFVGVNAEVVPDNLQLNVDFTGLAFIDNLVGDIVTATLNAFDAALLNALLLHALPTLNALAEGMVPDLGPISLAGLNVEHALDSAQFPPGAMRVSASMRVLPETPREGPAPERGALRRAAAMPLFAGGPFELAMGVSDDLVNQVLWSAWRGGAFDETSLSALGCDHTLPGAALSSFAALPPVLMPGAAAGTVDVGLGELQVSGTLSLAGGPVEVDLVSAGIVNGTLGVSAANQLTVAFGEGDQVIVDVTAISDSSALAAARTAVTPFFGCVLRSWVGGVINAIPVPALEPAGAVWRPGNVVIGREGSYTTLRGTMP